MIFRLYCSIKNVGHKSIVIRTFYFPRSLIKVITLINIQYLAKFCDFGGVRDSCQILTFLLTRGFCRKVCATRFHNIHIWLLRAIVQNIQHHQATFLSMINEMVLSHALGASFRRFPTQISDQREHDWGCFCQGRPDGWKVAFKVLLFAFDDKRVTAIKELSCDQFIATSSVLYQMMNSVTQKTTCEIVSTCM